MFSTIHTAAYNSDANITMAATRPVSEFRIIASIEIWVTGHASNWKWRHSTIRLCISLL